MGSLMEQWRDRRLLVPVGAVRIADRLSVCPACNLLVHRGDPIVKVRGGWVHDPCPPRRDDRGRL